jgi:succinoglycan biosynthesis protein ExoA
VNGPTVSVLVPVLNEAVHLERALELMRAQEVAGGLEILAIDGGSRDGSRQLLEQIAAKDQRVRVIDNPDRRTPNALNLGLQAARGQFVARMDAHTWYPPGYLAGGVQRLGRGDDVGWVSGPQIAEGVGRWSRRVALALKTPLGVGQARFRRSAAAEFDVDTAFTGVWRRDTLLGLGGWDEGWPVNQDTELAARLHADGERIVCLPELAARYVPRDGLVALARQYWRYGHYREKTARRHPDTMRPSHVLPPFFALAIAGTVAPGPQRGAARAALAAWLAAVLGESFRLAARGERTADVAGVPIVLATMHASWGAGFLAGCLRFGPPTGAIRRLVRRAAERRRGGRLPNSATARRILGF